MQANAFYILPRSFWCTVSISLGASYIFFERAASSTSMRFAIFFFAEYSNMFIVSMVAAVLFLGGWSGPFLPGPVWFLLKVYGVIFTMMWFRWTFPRLRFDQLMSFCWAVLVPLSILNLLITALIMQLTKVL